MIVLLALLTGQSAWADDGGSCGRSNVNGGNNVKWQYTESTGTLRIYPNTTDPSGDNFQTAQYTTWTHAPWYSYRANITKVIIEDGIQSIDNYFLDGCTALTSENITIPASVTRIGSWVFKGCTGLTTAPIGSGVTKISTFAFQNCTGLTSATIPASVTDFHYSAFDGCTSLTDITVEAENPNYKGVDGVMMNKDGTTLIRYPEGKTATSYTIPDGVTTIGGDAFNNNTHLITVTIPEDVTTINSAAFYYCTSLASVTIPETITTINSSVFHGCTSLTSVTIPASVTEIKYRAFGYCTALTSVYLMSATLPTIENVSGYNEFENVNANCHFYHYGTAYNSGDWTTMWSQMASNDPAWTGTHTVIGSVALPTGVTAETAVLNYNGTDYFASGETVTLSHTDRTGYTFDGYTVNGTPIGGNTFEMPASDVTVSATWTAAAVNIDNGVGNVITADDEITVPTLDYTRDFSAPGETPDANVGGVDVDVYTLCLPYAPATGAGIKYYTLSGSTGSTLQFTEIDGDPVADTPYLVTVSAETSVGNSIASPVELKKDVTASVTIGDYEFKGTTIGLTNAEAVAAGAYILMAGNQWGLVLDDTEAHRNAYIPPFRAYIVSTSGARSLDNEFGDGDTTGIQSLQLIDRDGKEHWFDLSGRRIAQPTKKGIYIVNGKKVVFNR